VAHEHRRLQIPGTKGDGQLDHFRREALSRGLVVTVVAREAQATSGLRDISLLDVALAAGGAAAAEARGAAAGTSESGSEPEPDPEPAPAEPAEIAASRAWISEAVVGYALCPWAKPSLPALSVRACPERGARKRLAHLEAAAEALAADDAPPGASEFVLCLDAAGSSFEDFNAFCDRLNRRLEKSGVGEDVTAIAFHPLFRYADADPDDAANFVNRSPYPAVHLLRHADLDEAVESIGGDASKVWKKNQAVLRGIGAEELARRLRVHNKG
jgi:hypothetical protein